VRHNSRKEAKGFNALLILAKEIKVKKGEVKKNISEEKSKPPVKGGKKRPGGPHCA